MSLFDPRRPDRLYHGGSFNGNVLGTACGKVAVEHLTPERIAAMDRRAAQLRATLERHAAQAGVPLVTSGVGSTFGVYSASSLPSPTGPRPDVTQSQLFQLAAVNRGVLFGDGGEAAIPTVLTDEVLRETERRRVPGHRRRGRRARPEGEPSMTIDRTPSAIGWSFSDVVSVSGPGRWLHVSGQVAFDKNGGVHGSVGEQSHGCFDHIEAVLARAGPAWSTWCGSPCTSPT